MAFTTSLSVIDDKATIDLIGELDSGAAPRLHRAIEEAMQSDVSRLELRATSLTYLSSAGLRALLFARQKMGAEGSVILLGASELIARTIRLAGLERSIQMTDA